MCSKPFLFPLAVLASFGSLKVLAGGSLRSPLGGQELNPSASHLGGESFQAESHGKTAGPLGARGPFLYDVFKRLLLSGHLAGGDRNFPSHDHQWECLFKNSLLSTALFFHSSWILTQHGLGKPSSVALSPYNDSGKSELPC